MYRMLTKILPMALAILGLVATVGLAQEENEAGPMSRARFYRSGIPWTPENLFTGSPEAQPEPPPSTQVDRRDYQTNWSPDYLSEMETYGVTGNLPPPNDIPNTGTPATAGMIGPRSNSPVVTGQAGTLGAPQGGIGAAQGGDFQTGTAPGMNCPCPPGSSWSTGQAGTTPGLQGRDFGTSGANPGSMGNTMQGAPGTSGMGGTLPR